MLKIIKRLSAVSVGALGLGLLVVGSAAAHVVVRPGEAVISERATFSVSVPNEHDTPVVGMRLLIPEGLTSVRPFAKAGWDISVSKSGEGEDATATEIIWTSAGGTVPVDLKDDFLFGAKLPAEPTELNWKAYETYQDGMIVAWDQKPNDAEDNRPYSITRVTAESEAAAKLARVEQAVSGADIAADRALYVGLAAIVIGIAGITLTLRKQS